MPVTISGTGSITGAGLNKKIAAFTASGTWTVPAAVTYAIAHMMGGGGGLGEGGTGGQGGDSSVAFASGTVYGRGLNRSSGPNSMDLSVSAGRDNTGQSASGVHVSDAAGASSSSGAAGVFTVAAAAVTPAASITVTVGAGGAAGTGGAAGGSGYVYIEYYAD